MIEHPDFPGWYVTPLSSDLLVSPEGNVLRMKTGNSTRGYLTENGYLSFRYYQNPETVYQTYVHRLVCSAFHGKPTEEKPHVNHKDGVKDNNWWENLEWVSALDNVNHAISTGLRMDKIPIVVWDIVSDSEVEYDSLAEYSVSIGKTKGHLSFSRLFQRTPIYKSRYYISPRDSERPTLDEVRSFNCVLGKEVLSDKEYLFSCPNELASWTNMSSSRVRAVLNDPKQRQVMGRFQIKRYSDPKPWKTTNEIDKFYIETGPDLIIYDKLHGGAEVVGSILTTSIRINVDVRRLKNSILTTGEFDTDRYLVSIYR